MKRSDYYTLVGHVILSPHIEEAFSLFLGLAVLCFSFIISFYEKTDD